MIIIDKCLKCLEKKMIVHESRAKFDLIIIFRSAGIKILFIVLNGLACGIIGEQILLIGVYQITHEYIFPILM